MYMYVLMVGSMDESMDGTIDVHVSIIGWNIGCIN